MASCGKDKAKVSDAAKEKAAAKKDEKKAKKENYMDGLSPQDRSDALKEIFKKADADGSKCVDWDEWSAAAKAVKGDKYDQKEEEQIFGEIDQTNNKSISFAEFDLWMATKQLEGVNERFKGADKDGSGALSKKEFEKFFAKEGMSEKNIKKLWKKCNANDDNKVTRKEFRDWMETEMADGVMKETFGFDANAVAAEKKKKKEAKEAKLKKEGKLKS